MSKMRVHELAKELNVESKLLMAKLKTSGAKIISHQSTLTDQQVSELRVAFGKAPVGSSSQPAAESGGGKPRVVIRRRAASSDSDAETSEPSSTPATPSLHAEEAEAAPIEVQAPPVAEVPPPPVQAPPPPVVKTPTSQVARASATVVRPSATNISRPTPSRPVEPPPPPPMSLHAPEPVQRKEEQRAAPPPEPKEEESRPVLAAIPAQAASPEAQAGKRREMGGATIVRRATPEEVAKLEDANKSRTAGRKEDHRGTRVTGLGLLGNRVSGDGGGAAGAPQAAAGTPAEQEDWARRAGGAVGASAKDKKGTEEAEEQARRKAAAKNRRSNAAFNARALLQQVDDLNSDEEVTQREVAGRTVYTPLAPRNKRDIRRRKDLKKTMITTPRASYRVVMMGEAITVGDLAKQLAIKATDLIKKLMAQGVMATINQSLDFDTATLLAADYQFEVRSNVQTVDDIIKKDVPVEEDAEQRPPIVTIMGHVDHGKTSLLDAIRSANVASGEAGGITQHIGAYSVEHRGEKISFLDTPGHEAFSAMRARGAKVTDIVVLVVAADDGVMPQTVEAINHAKAAGVPLIVAVNKIDKPQINLDRVYTELTEHGVQAEEWGGETQFIKTSAVQKKGIDDLLEAVLLQAEVLDLKATKRGFAVGAVIEAHLDKGRGPVATVMVQAGTLRVGDFIVAGTEYGRVRAMHDHRSRDMELAEPSDPVEIIGLSGVPMAGDQFNVVVDEKTAREVRDLRIAQARNAQAAKSSAQSLSDLLAKVKTQEVPEVPVIVKADTQGSVEAISESIGKLSTDRVRTRVLHAAVGGVTESDITLSASTGAMIFAFNVRATRGLDEVAERQGVPIKYFSIIYEIVDAMKAIMVGKLPPIVSELVLGHAEVRKPISVPKVGTIAGSAVMDGKITRNSMCRLLRDSIVIYTGKLGSLRRFKDDVKEVLQGYECGIGIEGYNDLREGDVIEAFVFEETAATL